MSLIHSARENLRKSARRILVIGPGGSGKTTFSVSASEHAGQSITKGGKRDCKDVILLSGDSEGVLGALDVGLEPGGVIDFTDCAGWVDKIDAKTRERNQGYKTRLAAAITELRPLVASGEVKVIVVDLALPAKLIVDHFQPEKIQGWTEVANEGLILFKAFSALSGATVIGNCQLKSGAPIESKDAALAAAARASAQAKAVGGELNTFTVDLPKGVASMWVDNSSFMFARRVTRERGRPGEHPRSTFATITQANGQFEAKSRAHTVLAPTEDGDRTLHSMLEAVYG